jgi:proteic killer suppression protein
MNKIDNRRQSVYDNVMERFRRSGPERLCTAGKASFVSAQHNRRIQLILAQLNVAHARTMMMDACGRRLHALKDGRKGQDAVSVSGNWRIIFECEGEDSTEIALIDYHGRKQAQS